MLVLHGHCTTMLARFLCLVLAVTTATAATIPLDLIDEHVSDQTTLNICPQLSVRCVAEGDWMHPIGYLGKRRKLWEKFLPHRFTIYGRCLSRTESAVRAGLSGVLESA
jgi:hypothetical protein